ncbi:GntR family transcriptional regulator / MocR family aminotransferase [Gracilibacillus ureilyticus]|uniref:GntR family transcriptional regulator / MocR family aminotransferase n=1 Tax=Gracilibacillus ureilyticus TaxID=531814 RepID=A0A1H9Q3Z8_9BACI|nr:PLP-dependent aminotransferase family protein [Gracilibacillus ureilyticus]SER55138.1 GntR family transcriptional regulator / MocR family aminotransferase [Gracilibacillus ureilyticus]
MNEITPPLDHQSKQPLYLQISDYFKQEIVRGKIKAMEKLPSKRVLANHLGISLNTVQAAYEQLRAEGFIKSEERKGLYVQEIEGGQYFESTPHYSQQTPSRSENTEYLIDFNSGKVDLDQFPYHLWRKLTTEALYEENSMLLQMGDPQGEYSLRTEIAAYLYQSRGVNCSPEQIVIAAGTQQLVGLLSILIGPDYHYALEDPGFHRTKQVLKDYRITTVPISLDQSGISVKELLVSQAKVVYVTPSHQFPNGMVMPISRRMELLKWARETGSFIIEDDYDGEYRYKGKPIPSLQGLDRHGSVIYLGTFSKSLIPSIRTSYAVLPPALTKKYQVQLTIYKQTVSRFHQDTLYKFMQRGHYQRHLNKMRALYRKKHNILLNAIEKKMGESVKVIGENAGLHILLRVCNGMTEEQLIKSASEKSVKVYPTSIYHDKRLNGEPEILMGFGGLAIEEIEEGIQILKEVWKI